MSREQLLNVNIHYNTMASVVCWNNLPSVVLLEIFKMISHEERIIASTTCKEWRKALFFPNFWRDICFNIYSKNDKYVIERCQFFLRSFVSSLRNVKIIFSYKIHYLCQFDDVMMKLSENRQVKRLFLYGLERPKSNQNLSSCATSLLDFLGNVKCLDALQISHCWLLLLENNNLKLALEKHKESLTSLGIGAVLTFRQQTSKTFDLPVDFSVFQRLTTLSLDHMWITDEALKQICDLKSLKRLIVLVHAEFKGHGTKKETWEVFHKSMPDCELRINLIMGDSEDVMRIFLRTMPVTHIKILYCHDVDLSLMSIFSSFINLKSVWYLADRKEEDIFLPEQNPLVICAWTCQKLEELVITGFPFDYEDLIGIARLRSSKLKRLDISRTDIVKLIQHEIEDDSYWTIRKLYFNEMNSFNRKMSAALGRTWSPVDGINFGKSNTSPLDKKINNIVEILSKDYVI